MPPRKRKTTRKKTSAKKPAAKKTTTRKRTTKKTSTKSVVGGTPAQKAWRLKFKEAAKKTREWNEKHPNNKKCIMEYLPAKKSKK